MSAIVWRSFFSMKYKQDKKIELWPLAFIKDEPQRELDRLSALNIHLLKLRMIDRTEIARTIEIEVNVCERQYYKNRLNYYLNKWKDRKYDD
ncbi:hypothetical protein PBPRB1442 [Photobacterium profundum SS9]|uniref:Uncharacterized protein n=1 Tax=Photobacterium profundum (strain SS9) TaxID=298386 RepID=Q6LHC2_PHOPR|nr:hypothetical protein PBPRB1442 [Photobacterium profundum SS9]